MKLIDHIKKINAKSKKWMDENPGSWAGMLVEDIKHWNDQGIFTIEDFDRQELETSIYEMHKQAFGVKGRHYNFKEMSLKQLEKELDMLCEVAKTVRETEKKYEEAAYQTFLKRITESMKLGAETKEDAIKWILQAEDLENEKDTSYICYKLGLNYDKEYLFKKTH